MKIYVNGEEHEVAEGMTIAELLAHLAMQGRRLAVEVNEEIVPRSEHERRRLRPGDRVEVVQAIGGGM